MTELQTRTKYAYDDNGNTIVKTDGTGATSYAWDYENRLSSVTLPGSSGTVSFKYDPFGRRIYKSFSTGTSIYAYDGDNLIEETNSSGAALARYSQGLNIDEPLAMLRNATTSYYQADGLGSITSLTNTAGAAAQTYTYDSFGSLTATTGSLTNSFRYTGREFDTETSLYYYRARYYDPGTGRFVSEDPIDFAGGIDFYRYVLNNPTVFFDPTGLREYPNNFVGPLPPDGYYTSQMEQTRCGRIPPHPPGSDVNHNISDAKDHLNPWWFKGQVKNKGPWDYKQKGRIYEDFGNFNYGAGGHAFGFPDNTLLREAGRANQIADPRRKNMGLGDPGPRWNPWGGKPPYGDDPQDQEQINRGIAYCKCELGQKP